MENKNNSKVLEMARKKRHIYLLEKIQKGKSLSKSELQELERYEGQSLPAGIVRTRAEVAKVMKRSVRTIDFWIKEGMPTRSDGTYDLKAVKEWKGKNRQDKDTDTDKAVWESRLKESQAKLKQLEYKRIIGELLPREEVERGRVARILAVKRAFLALPRAIAPQLVGLEPREIETILTTRVREIIKKFSDI